MIFNLILTDDSLNNYSNGNKSTLALNPLNYLTSVPFLSQSKYYIPQRPFCSQIPQFKLSFLPETIEVYIINKYLSNKF